MYRQDGTNILSDLNLDVCQQTERLDTTWARVGVEHITMCKESIKSPKRDSSQRTLNPRWFNWSQKNANSFIFNFHIESNKSEWKFAKLINKQSKQSRVKLNQIISFMLQRKTEPTIVLHSLTFESIAIFQLLVWPIFFSSFYSFLANCKRKRCKRALFNLYAHIFFLNLFPLTRARSRVTVV